VLATLSRWRSRVQIPSGPLSNVPGQVAQLVEHTTENRGVGGSIPPLTTTPTLVLLCAPSLGILDNWLPVLHAARASHPDWRIVALIPDRSTLAQLDPSDTAHVLADDVIDATVAPLHGGGWVLADGFLGSVHAASPRRMFPRLRTREQRARLISLQALSGPRTRLLYDVHVAGKPKLQALFDELEGVTRFSLNHGLDLERTLPDRRAVRDLQSIFTAFLYSPSEQEAYGNNFGLTRSQMLVVGVPRHDQFWVSKLVDRSLQHHAIPNAPSALLISRPSGSTYLPRDRKIAAIRTLHRVVCEEHGLRLLIRRHPKEVDDGTFEEALPSEGVGTQWEFVAAHPFHLARNAEFAITFFSGVSMDLVAAGVPVIEFLDVRGLPAHDHPAAGRDPRGRPAFSPYRSSGLVLAADDADDFRRAIAVVHADREAVVNQLRSALDRQIPLIEDASSRIVEMISRSYVTDSIGE